MALDNFIVSDFVKATTEKKKKNETTVFGTVNSYTDSDGRKYVKIDGAEELTPVMTTAELKEGDRVAILIKDHSAVIMGNITSQSASTDTVEKVNQTANAAKDTADSANTAAADAKQTADNLEERANNGEFKGSDGKNGADGRGIANITEYYLVSPSSSGITTSTSGWSTDIQGMTSYKKYLWNYRKTTYTTGDPTITTPCIIGTYGEKGDPGAQGDPGATGRSVEEIVDQYAKSASSSIAPANSDFSEQIPEWTSGEYIWRRQKITWLLSDGTTGTSYTDAVADMAFSTLFAQDIYMTGTFTTTKQLYLMPTVTEYNKVKGYIETEGSSTYISSEEFDIFDINHDGDIDEYELAWFKDGAFGRGSITQTEMETVTEGFDASGGPYTSAVTFTISLQDPNTIIHITGTNLWGSKIDCQIGSSNPFVSAGGDLDKVQLDALLDESSDVIDKIQSDITLLKVLTGSMSEVGSNGQVLKSDGTKVYWGTDNNTDTKNTAGSTNTSSKIFLIGATSQAANPQTYSHDTAYVGTDGCLYSGGTKVSVSGHTHSYAGSSSAGGAANSVARNLIIQLNGGTTEGTDLFTFNGSAIKTVNITPSSIGITEYTADEIQALWDERFSS